MSPAVHKERQSNFELLRIISMLLIVAVHYYEFGFSIPEDQPVTFNYLFLRFFGFGGHMAVDIFVLISGYFLCVGKTSLKKAIKIWLQTAAAVLLGAVLGGSFGLKSIADAALAIPKGYYWFITTYFLLYIFSDYLSAMLRALGRKKHFILLCLLLAVYSVLPTCLAMRMDSSNFMLFVTLYVIAAYIRMYSPKLLESKYCLVAGIGFHWLCWAASAVLVVLGGRYPAFLHLADRMSAASDITIICAAVLIFAGFKNLDIGCSKLINEIGSSTFGVYLIHATSFVMTTVLVQTLRTPEFLGSRWLCLHAVASVAVIFAGCAVIDILYRRLIEKPILTFLYKRIDIWGEKLRRHLPASDGQ